VAFLLRSKVFPQIEHQLRSSLEVIELAKFELPNTSNIAKTFPDKFSQACNACWGKKADGYDPGKFSKHDNTLEEPKAKRQKCDTDIPAKFTDSWAAGSVYEWGAVPAAVLGSSWGQDIKVTDENSGWGQDVKVTNENSGWGPSSPIESSKSLLSLLGPTVLPLTHFPGIVERSMRRIVSITRPSSLVTKSPPLPEGVYEPNPDAVELELDRRFAKVVFAPMIDWDGGEAQLYRKPAILATSQGSVVNHHHSSSVSPTCPQPHDPESDEITVVIDDIASQIDYLREGMAIGGTWVELVRQGDPVVSAKKKGKSKKASYWYLDEVALIVPSFWTIDN
jgi:hypothetical protein